MSPWPAARLQAVLATMAVLAVSIAPAQTGPTQTGDFNPVINPVIDEPQQAAAPKPVVQDLPRVELDLRSGTIEERIARILEQMTLEEKIGQLCQLSAYGEELSDNTAEGIRAGRIGSLFYTGSASQIREAQRVAQEESRLGLPLLTPRDVIHGFRTVAPIPLGQAASWNPELVEAAAELAAEQALAEGVNWTFAPMMDICRDARWGRIAESLGEDPLLASALAEAMVRGFQGEETTPDGLTRYHGIAACAKHYVGYGLSEGGRDYNRAQVAVSELRNVFLRPFRASVDANCMTLMTGFNSVNGVPGTGHRGLVRGVLKEEWGFEGLVVSDWGSVVEMIEHGYAADRKEAAWHALEAGVDMEMATTTFIEHLGPLVESGALDTALIDDAVARVLRVKLLFALPREEKPSSEPTADAKQHASDLARKLARQSVVLLKNQESTLPLDSTAAKRVAVLGPLADAARDQLGCWMLDGDPAETSTPAKAIAEALGDDAEVVVVPALESSVDDNTEGIAAAAEAAAEADIAIVCVGEGWQLSGEARSRVDLNLPGAQRQLVEAIAATETPMVLVVLAGRPLTIGNEVELADAVLYAWHPGTMGGAAIADLLTGVESPSGKLPVTFPKHVGQAPLYYNHPNTGRPALPGTQALIGSGLPDFPEEQKYRSHYLDVDPFPLFPFGYGLSYSTFEYGEPELSNSHVEPGQTLGVRVTLKNTGDRPAEEVAQLYVQDVTASLVRPVRELRAFRRVRLDPGESTLLEFAIPVNDLAYYNNQAQSVLEPGEFRLGVGGDSTAPLTATFNLNELTVGHNERTSYQEAGQAEELPAEALR